LLNTVNSTVKTSLARTHLTPTLSLCEQVFFYLVKVLGFIHR